MCVCVRVYMYIYIYTRIYYVLHVFILVSVGKETIIEKTKQRFTPGLVFH